MLDKLSKVVLRDENRLNFKEAILCEMKTNDIESGIKFQFTDFLNYFFRFFNYSFIVIIS